jgi:two-component system OmpR family response regulator
MTAPFIQDSSAVGHTPLMRVLVVEDEARMASVIRLSLIKEGLATDTAADGDQAISMATAVDYDVIVLDVMLPARSGFETCRVLREHGVWSPVLMLTARDAVEDRVAGLDSGADDYLIKPFALAELQARLRALIRRGRPERPTVLRVGDLRLDPARHEVHRGSVRIDLSSKEYALLEALMRRPGEVLTRLDLLEQAWDFAYETRSNIVDVYVRRLRRKIDEPFSTGSLDTVRGVGYRLLER